MQCRALSASGCQCSRRVNKNSETGLCGTHMRGTPHGILDAIPNGSMTQSRIEVRVQDICGINYYIDDAHNVYDPRDVVGRNTQPRVIGQWVKSGDDDYAIPALGLSSTLA